MPGSILEDDDQQGLAHFLEHMAFNGTERFAEPELVRYLESVGTRFGPDLNAYTSFDETVYMLQVPTDSADVFATGLDVLREWAGRVTLADSAVERERGVVLEEWRLRRGAGERMQRVQFPIIYGGSRYAERLPIGLPEVIQNAPTDALRRFYDDWYRPDLMDVVVVGDVDVDDVEAMIRSRFSDLVSRGDSPTRETFEVPSHDDTRYAIATDPEAPQTLVQILFKRPPTRTRTVEDARTNLVNGLFFSALRSRIDEIRQKPGAPFAFAFVGSGGGLRTLDEAYLVAFAAEDRIEDAARVLVTEAERARRFGITATEVEREKAELIRRLQSAVAEKDDQPSAQLAQAYVQSFLQDEPVISPETRLMLAESLLPSITLDEVNATAEELVDDRNRVVVVSAPQRDDLEVPTDAQMAAALASVATADLEPYEDATSDEPLIAAIPAAGSIEDESTDDDLGTTTWTLSNGATVVLKPTTFMADEVLFSATSPGGSSLLEDDQVAVAGGAAGYVSQSGVGAFDQIALGKRLSGQIVQLRPIISSRSEGFTGSAAPGDLETLFQLAHLYVTSPRKDADAFQAAIQQTRTFLTSQGASPRVAFSDTLNVTLADYHPRTQTLSQYLDGLDRADLDEAFAFYQDRFADVSDFTFFLVGSFDLEAVRPFVTTYLASLPGGGRDEEPRDIEVVPPDGVVEKVVRAGVEPQAQVAIVFHGEIDADDNEDRAIFNATADVLSKMLREELREDRGGVYGVGVRPSIDREDDQYTLQISFGADPDRVDELVEAVFAEVEALRTGGAAPEHLEAYKEQQRRGRETNLQQNRYWLGVLTSAAQTGEPAQNALDEPDIAARLAMDDIRDMAVDKLDMERYVRVTLLPVE